MDDEKIYSETPSNGRYPDMEKRIIAFFKTTKGKGAYALPDWYITARKNFTVRELKDLYMEATKPSIGLGNNGY